MGRKTRTKTTPFKLLVLMQHHEYDWLTRPAGTYWEAQLRGICRLMRVSYARAREYLQWLEQRGYIQDLILTEGLATFHFKRGLRCEPWQLQH